MPRIGLIACGSGYALVTLMEKYHALLVEIEDTIPVLIADTSYREVTRLRVLMTEIRVYNAEFAIGSKEESPENLRLTLIDFTERVRPTRSEYSPGKYASAQRGRLTKWRAVSGRK